MQCGFTDACVCAAAQSSSLQAFEKASGKKVNYRLADRRGGDSTEVFAATEAAKQELGWSTRLDVDAMCRDQWAWASRNPKGYES